MNKKYKYHYSEDFEQFRIHLTEDRNFWVFTRICGLNTPEPAIYQTKIRHKAFVVPPLYLFRFLFDKQQNLL